MTRVSLATDSYRQLAARWRQTSPERLEDLLSGSFPLAFSYNSGKIENEEITLHDTREIFEKGRVVSFTGDVRTLFEIQNLRDAWS